MAPVMLLVAALIAVAPDRADKEPTYKVEVNKVADSVVAEMEKDRTILVVTSESGIGGATVLLAGGKWPANVTLRFLYSKGKGFHSLEDIWLSTDQVVVQGAENVGTDSVLLRGARRQVGRDTAWRT
jgi:hypothetical protein